jgi:hypothetical protein
MDPRAMRKPLFFFLIKNRENKNNESSVIGFAKKKKNLLPKIGGIRKKWYITIFIEKMLLNAITYQKMIFRV